MSKHCIVHNSFLDENAIIDLCSLAPKKKKPEENRIIRWKGILRDGKQRILCIIPRYNTNKIYRKNREGNLMSNYTIKDLIEIAWEIGVSCLGKLNRNNYSNFKMTEEHAHKEYLLRWKQTRKQFIIDCIWHRLEILNHIEY